MTFQKNPLWTALVTPFLKNGDLDQPSLENLVRQQERAENGILLLGSTGEALNLSLQDKLETLEAFTALSPRSPLMVGVGGHDLEATLSWVAELESHPLVKAYLMPTPLYAKPGDKGQYIWFKNLLDLSSKPVMLYNVPGRTGVPLSLEAVHRLASHPRFWAIKEASGSVLDFKRYREAAQGVSLYSGDDALVAAFSPFGCQGLVSVAANAWPKATRLYTKKALEGRLSPEEKSLWQKAIEALFQSSNPVPIKRLLQKKGVISSATLRPPLSEKDLPSPLSLLTADKTIQEWENK